MINVNEKFNCVSPANDIKCATCKNKIGNSAFSNDYRKACCKVFEYPVFKPVEILTENADCKFYEKE